MRGPSLTPALDDASAACASRTVGPSRARLTTAALSIGAIMNDAVSDAAAVTGVADSTSRVSARLELRTLLCAVSRASCALPTATNERSESEMMAAPARTRATAADIC